MIVTFHFVVIFTSYSILADASSRSPRKIFVFIMIKECSLDQSFQIFFILVLITKSLVSVKFF